LLHFLKSVVAAQRYDGGRPFLLPPSVAVVVEAKRRFPHPSVGEQQHEPSLASVLDEAIDSTHHALTNVGDPPNVIFLRRVGLGAIRLHIVSQRSLDLVGRK